MTIKQVIQLLVNGKPNIKEPGESWSVMEEWRRPNSESVWTNLQTGEVITDDELINEIEKERNERVQSSLGISDRCSIKKEHVCLRWKTDLRLTRFDSPLSESQTDKVLQVLHSD